LEQQAPNPVPPQLTPWKPGVSGNPLGRPKKTPEDRSAEAILRGGAVKAARLLVKASQGEKFEQSQLKAIELVLAYTLGKPATQIGLDIAIKQAFGGPSNDVQAQLDAVRRMRAALLLAGPVLDLEPSEDIPAAGTSD
jgi:hypothetical protein